MVTTIIAVMKYGVNTHSNLLQGLPPSLLLYITVLLVTLQLCLTSAVSNSTLFQHVEDYLSIPRGILINLILFSWSLFFEKFKLRLEGYFSGPRDKWSNIETVPLKAGLLVTLSRFILIPEQGKPCLIYYIRHDIKIE